MIVISEFRNFGIRISDCSSGTMTRSDLEGRTRVFAVSTIRFVDKMPKTETGRILGRQLLRSATSIGANYREGNRAESRKDFIHKIAIVEKETAETLYWIELLTEAGSGEAAERKILEQECNQLVAIFTRIGKTTKQQTNPKSEIRNPQSENG
jgi:four helix bundle protein